MQILQSSYGLLGIVYEVTYKIKALTPMRVHHTTYNLKDFVAAFPDFKELGYSTMYYIFPFVDGMTHRVVVEERRRRPYIRQVGSAAVSGPPVAFTGNNFKSVLSGFTKSLICTSGNFL